MLFGAVWGLALTITGTALAALAAYGLVRWVGGPLVARHEHRPGFAWVRARLDRSGLLAMVSLRLLPMVPFSVLNYAAGVARVRLVPYLLGTVLGVLPGTVAIVVLGDAVTSGDVNPALFAGVRRSAGAALRPRVPGGRNPPPTRRLRRPFAAAHRRLRARRAAARPCRPAPLRRQHPPPCGSRLPGAVDRGLQDTA